MKDGCGTHHPVAIFVRLGGRLGSLYRDLTSALPSAARPLIGRPSEEPRPRLRLRRLLGSCGRGRAAAAWEKESRGRHAVAAGGEARETGGGGDSDRKTYRRSCELLENNVGETNS